MKKTKGGVLDYRSHGPRGPSKPGGMLARRKKHDVYVEPANLCASELWSQSEWACSLSHKISYTGGTVDKRDFQGLSGLYRVLLYTELNGCKMSGNVTLAFPGFSAFFKD